MKRLFCHLRHDTVGSSAAEFAMVLPLLIIFLIGIIDVGRLMWTWNEAEKATQMGVRFAIVTDPVPSGFAGYDFVGTSSLTQGDVIPTNTYGTMTCTSTASSGNTPGTVSCSCTSGTCPWGTAAASGSSSPFRLIYNRMKMFLPQLKDNNVRVLYKPSGLGFAGDPNGPDASPIVTVQLTGLSFTPALFQFFRGSITLPDFSAALIMEDGQGTASN